MSPVVTLSTRDILRDKIADPGWYRMKIESVGEAPSKDGGSTNYPVEGTILCNADDGTETFAGVPVSWMFNSKAIGFSVGFLKAIGVDVQPDKPIELGGAVGEILDVYIDNELYQNRTVMRVNHKYRAKRAA